MAGILAKRSAKAFELLRAGQSWVEEAGSVIRAGLLLASRAWLGQAIFIHQLMAMMHDGGFDKMPPVAATLIRDVAPMLLVTGLLTRPVASLLAVGVGLQNAGAMLTEPRWILLAWLAVGGAGPLSLDFLLRRGLARVPFWAVTAGNRFYRWCDTVGGVLLPLITRLAVALMIAAGSGFAAWAVPGTGSLVTLPWWLLLPCWALILGAGTRPAALLLAAVAPAVFPGAPPGQFEVVLLLGLVAAGGAGAASLDTVCARWIRLALYPRDRANGIMPHVVVVGGGFGASPRFAPCAVRHAGSRS